MQCVVQVEGVGKAYELGERETRGLLSERVSNALRGRFRGGDRRSRRERFWALRDVSLEIARGEVVGLVGANGAGKSTLLKLLAEITYPTEGRIALWGRVATMLEVGTGFHPELTGRENIYLNGSILGMRQREIEAKFDEIVEFSGVEKFLDTPVKRYSSGMFVRLAFAVAAHLDPEILLIDEVLAVGDADFQRKCLGKMRDVAEDEGRTIVFVSHNLSAVQRLCSRSYWLHEGAVAAAGPSQDVIAAYLKRVGSHQHGGVAEIGADVPRVGTGDARLMRVEMVGGDGEPIDKVLLGQRFSLRLTFEVHRPINDGVIELGICAADGTRVITVQNIDGERPPLAMEPGMWIVETALETTLLPGDFTVDVGFHRQAGLTWDYAEQVFAFAALNVAEQGGDHYPWNIVRGSVRPPTEWVLRSPVADTALPS